MTRLAPPSPHSPLGTVRQTLERLETQVTHLRGSGTSAVEILTALDEVSASLHRLEAAGANVRAEAARLESVWRMLQRRAALFVREAGPALAAARQGRDEDSLQPWWTLDRSVSLTQRRLMRRGLLIGLGLFALLLGGWLAYDRFVAPPPKQRLAMRYLAQGQELVGVGEMTQALTEFEAAAALTPDDAEVQLWVCVLRRQAGDETGAQAACAAARGMLDEAEFFCQRGDILLSSGDLEAAAQDAAAAIEAAPDSGYGYYLRGSVAAMRGEVEAAIADYRTAADLAHAADDIELEAAARAQEGLLLQYAPGQ